MNESLLSRRRRFLKLAGGASAAVVFLTALPRRVMAALPHLTISNDATAKALHYVEDSTEAVAPQGWSGMLELPTLPRQIGRDIRSLHDFPRA